jgi:hypothetical protein
VLRCFFSTENTAEPARLEGLRLSSAALLCTLGHHRPPSCTSFLRRPIRMMLGAINQSSPHSIQRWMQHTTVSIRLLYAAIAALILLLLCYFKFESPRTNNKTGVPKTTLYSSTVTISFGKKDMIALKTCDGYFNKSQLVRLIERGTISRLHRRFIASFRATVRVAKRLGRTC